MTYFKVVDVFYIFLFIIFSKQLIYNNVQINIWHLMIIHIISVGLIGFDIKTITTRALHCCFTGFNYITLNNYLNIYQNEYKSWQ